MFCPKCGTDNADGSKFCRACGTNISLVPQALSGQLPQVQKDNSAIDWEMLGMSRRRRRRYSSSPSMSYGFSKLFMGIAFIVVALALSTTPFGWSWWFWMLIPAFGAVGKGIGEIVQVRSEQKKNMLQPPTQQQPLFQPTQQVNSLPRLNTTEFMDAPPSITENTTRHLGAEMPTKVFEDRN